MGHVVSCKLGAKCSRDDCSNFKLELHDQFYDNDESDNSTTSGDSCSIDSYDVSENSKTSDNSNDSDDESDSSNTSDSSNDCHDENDSSRSSDDRGDCTVSRFSRGYCRDVDSDSTDKSDSDRYPKDCGNWSFIYSDCIWCLNNIDSNWHLEDGSTCQLKICNLDKNDYDSNSSVPLSKNGERIG